MAAPDAGEIQVPEDDQKQGKYVVSDPNAHLALSPTVGVVVRKSSRPSPPRQPPPQQTPPQQTPPQQTPPGARSDEAGDNSETRDAIQPAAAHDAVVSTTHGVHARSESGRSSSPSALKPRLPISADAEAEHSATGFAGMVDDLANLRFGRLLLGRGKRSAKTRPIDGRDAGQGEVSI